MSNECYDIEGSLVDIKNPSKMLFYNDEHSSCIVNHCSSTTSGSFINRPARLTRLISVMSQAETKYNSYMRVLLSTSLYEIGLFFASLYLFISLPYSSVNVFLFIVLLFHFIKAIIGMSLINQLPKTYEICENFSSELYTVDTEGVEGSAKEPKDLLETVKYTLKKFIIKGLEDCRPLVSAYFFINIFAVTIDVATFIIYYVAYSFYNTILMQGTILLIIIVLFAGSLIYFLWFALLKFSFEDEVAAMIKKVLSGNPRDLQAYVKENL